METKAFERLSHVVKVSVRSLIEDAVMQQKVARMYIKHVTNTY